MAKKTQSLNLRKIKIKFTGDNRPPPPPPPPSHESGVVVAKLEAGLQSDRTTRIISLIVTGKEITPRYRRRTGTESLGTTVDLARHGAHATAKDVLVMLANEERRLRLRRIVDAERGVALYEPQWEASQLAAFIYLETIMPRETRSFRR